MIPWFTREGEAGVTIDVNGPLEMVSPDEAHTLAAHLRIAADQAESKAKIAKALRRSTEESQT